MAMSELHVVSNDV